MSNSETPWAAVHQASLSITNFQSLLKLMSVESVMPSNHLILCHPLLLPPTFNLSQHQGSFQVNQFLASGGQSIGALASASILPMNIQDSSPLRMDWLDLLAVQGTLKSLLQYHSSILWCSAFFANQLYSSIK